MTRFILFAIAAYSSGAIGAEADTPSVLMQIIISWFPTFFHIGLLVSIVYGVRYVFRGWHDDHIDVLRKIERHLAHISGDEGIDKNNGMHLDTDQVDKNDGWKK